ncbi:MAG TPA: amidohydrolase family protein [Chloroflexota bacterium]
MSPTAPPVAAIRNVTALIGEDFAPRVVDLTLRDGRIAALAPAEQGEGADTAAAHGAAADGVALDGRALLAVPGFVDVHDHFRFLTPGLPIGEGLKLDEFLRVMWQTGQAMGPAEYRLGARLTALQRLKLGMTTVVDHCYTFHAPGLDEASLAGYAECGVRWLYARGIMTRPYEPVCETWDAAAATMRALVEGGRVPPDRFFVAPVSIRQTRPDEYRRARDLADALGCGLYTHVSETAAEQEVWQRECGATPIRALDQLGFLTPRTVLVHCVILDDGEIALLRERGCHVVHCPTNHMKLAKGFTRVPDLLRAGVNVAIGLDGSSDMLVEMRSELGMHAAHRLDPTAVSKLDALRMATINGARALGLGTTTGLIAPGRAADLVLTDLRSVLQAPVVDPVYTLLYATHAGMIRHVLVEGRLVVRDGRSTLVDEDALLEEAEAIVAAYLRRIGFEPGPWLAPAPAHLAGSY